MGVSELVSWWVECETASGSPASRGRRSTHQLTHSPHPVSGRQSARSIPIRQGPLASIVAAHTHSRRGHVNRSSHRRRAGDRRLGLALAAPRRSASARPATPIASRSTGRVTEPNGRTTDYVVMSGRAMVTEKAAGSTSTRPRWKRGAMAEQGQLHPVRSDVDDDRVAEGSGRSLRLRARESRAGMRRSRPTCPACAMRRSATSPSTSRSSARGEPMLGMATTKYRLTQDYKVATRAASVSRNSTEHIVQDVWMADEQKGARQSVRAPGPCARRRRAAASTS